MSKDKSIHLEKVSASYTLDRDYYLDHTTNSKKLKRDGKIAQQARGIADKPQWLVLDPKNPRGRKRESTPDLKLSSDFHMGNMEYAPPTKTIKE